MSELFKDVTNTVELVYEDLVPSLSSCACIKFSVYRTASKLHFIQRFLWFDQIHLDIINGVFTKHRIFSCENKMHISIDELKDILYDIYFISFKDMYSSDNIRIDILVNLCVKFLYSAFELNGRSNFKVLDVKIALACLTSCQPIQKFKYWFSQLADHNLCLSARNFRCFLESISQLTKYLSESKTMCEHVIESSMHYFDSQFNSYFGISELDFLGWVSTKPSFLSWLLVYYRFCVSKNLVHSVKCSFCQMDPIVGLRYFCSECLSYNLCHTCFFSGKVNKNHKRTHVVQEYCAPVSSYRTTSVYLKSLVKKLCTHKKKVVSDETQSQSQDSADVDSGNGSVKSQPLFNMDMSGLPSDQLNDIICRIENETKQLTQTNSNSVKDLINKHTAFLQEQIDELKDVQKRLENAGSRICMSTPIHTRDLSAIHCPVATPSSLCLDQSHSDFSLWIKSSQEDNEHNHLQADLDNVLAKIHGMLEKSFWNYD